MFSFFFFNHDTLLALTAEGSLAWQPNLLALCQLWGIFLVLGIPRRGGTTAVWSRAQISASGAVHSERGFLARICGVFLLFLGLFDFINN